MLMILKYINIICYHQIVTQVITVLVNTCITYIAICKENIMLKYLINIKMIRELRIWYPCVTFTEFGISVLHLQKRLEYEQYAVEYYIVLSTGYQGRCL
jgi:hypothetical protein